MRTRGLHIVCRVVTQTFPEGDAFPLQNNVTLRPISYLNDMQCDSSEWSLYADRSIRNPEIVHRRTANNRRDG
jgi:hypothetical protein